MPAPVPKRTCASVGRGRGAWSGGPDDRAGHAMAAAPTASELLPGDCEDLDAGLRELRVRRLVALVATTTPGSSATTLLPSSHWLRSASNSSPPVVTTLSSAMPRALGPRPGRGRRRPRLHAAVPVRRQEQDRTIWDHRLVDRDDVAVADGTQSRGASRRSRGISAPITRAALRRPRTGSGRGCWPRAPCCARPGR